MHKKDSFRGAACRVLGRCLADLLALLLAAGLFLLVALAGMTLWVRVHPAQRPAPAPTPRTTMVIEQGDGYISFRSVNVN